MQGYVLYEGPSLINRDPIVCIATGFLRPSSNAKTGPMIQTNILHAEVSPYKALATGKDAAMCGGCGLRAQVRDGVSYGQRGCYVNVTHDGQRSIWEAWRKGSYPVLPNYDVFRNRRVRFGAYGDPAAIPLTVWSNIAQVAAGWTGYTHQWRSERLRGVTAYCMASCETDADELQALELGLSPYRIVPDGELPLFTSAIPCPATKEQGRQTTCFECLACNGQGNRTIYAQPHGNGAKWVHQAEEVSV